MAESYKIIAEQDYCTVVAKYESSRKNGNAYQSEQDLERWLIEQLQRQGYEYPSIHNEKELLENLRIQLGKANDTEYSDKEWTSLLNILTSETLTMEDKADMIQ